MIDLDLELEEICTGKKTINQMRVAHGLSPIDDESCNSLFIKKPCMPQNLDCRDSEGLFSSERG